MLLSLSWSISIDCGRNSVLHWHTSYKHERGGGLQAAGDKGAVSASTAAKHSCAHAPFCSSTLPAIRGIPARAPRKQEPIGVESGRCSDACGAVRDTPALVAASPFRKLSACW